MHAEIIELAPPMAAEPAATPNAPYSTEDLWVEENPELLPEMMESESHSGIDEILLPRPGFGSCRFARLTPVSDGTGPYHVNNHIGFFNPPAGFNISTELDRFFANFPRIFSPGNLAAAMAPSCRVGGDITIQFVLNDLPGLIHDDWVVMRKNTGNFVATTLERKFWSRGDYILDLGASAIPGLGPLFAGISADINRRHFLAGYRSWTIGRLPTGLHFVETAAFERYSHPAYLAFERAVGMRGKILEIWTKLIENYLRSIGASPVRHVPAGYSMNRGVAHREQQDANATTLRSSPWIASLLSRHPGL